MNDCKRCRALEQDLESLAAERDEAIFLLKAIWHGLSPAVVGGEPEFSRRVEALVGPPPDSGVRNVTTRLIP